jgi:hypothetical protein
MNAPPDSDATFAVETALSVKRDPDFACLVEGEATAEEVVCAIRNGFRNVVEIKSASEPTDRNLMGKPTLRQT